MAVKKKRLRGIVSTGDSVASVKPMINIGAGVDLLVGRWEKASDGGWVINGGLPQYWAISGPANSYKSGLLLSFKIIAADRLSHIADIPMFTYDTENTYETGHLEDFLSRTTLLNDGTILYNGVWRLVNKSMKMLGAYWDDFKEWQQEILKNKKSLMVTTPFVDKKTSKAFVMPLPSFNSIDSISEVESETTKKKEDKVKMGEDKARMYFMNMGFDKARMLTSLGPMTMRSGTYTLLSSHFGEDKKLETQTGIKLKKMTAMPAGKAFKGVPDKFDYLLMHIWLTKTAVVLKDSTGGAIKYPRKQVFKDEKPGDLQRVTGTTTRSKTSPDGRSIDFIVSQRYGLQPELTELEHLRHPDKGKGYGIVGSAMRYAMDLYPEVVMMRTTARELIDGDAKLRRAIDITMEMFQTFSLFLYDEPKLHCTPAELRRDLEALGYDWNKILESRGWWTVEDSSHPIPRLTTMDLLYLRIGEETERAKWALKTKKPSKEKEKSTS